MFSAGKSMNEDMGRYVRPESPTLLDQFAMAALTGLCTYPGRVNETNDPEHFAKWSYALAQAMMKAREND